MNRDTGEKKILTGCYCSDITLRNLNNACGGDSLKGIYKYVTQLANAQRRLIDRLAKERAYSGTQGKVIHYLFEHRDKTVYQKDIERDFGMRPATATELIKTLEKLELVRRIPGEKDARFKEIILTEKAENLQKSVSDDMEWLERCMMKGLSEEELALWEKVTLKMMDNMREE